MFKFSQGERVVVNYPPIKNGIGTIVGCSSAKMPILGQYFIVQFDDPQAAGIDPEQYPFTCGAFPEISIAKLGEKSSADYVGESNEKLAS